MIGSISTHHHTQLRIPTDIGTPPSSPPKISNEDVNSNHIESNQMIKPIASRRPWRYMLDDGITAWQWND